MNVTCNITFRPATAADAPRIAEIYLASRAAFVAFAPLTHSELEIRDWIAATLIPAGGVTVAVQNGEIVGMMALSREDEMGWLDQLYLHPTVVGQGIGTQFVQRAKAEMGAPLRLYTFRANAAARGFYERHGFRVIALSDGQGNQEKCPDVLYEWSGAEA